MKRYGLPYKGSKNSIAKAILDFLPQGGTLVDLFGGGGAITCAALEQFEGMAPKWQHVMYNDVDPLVVQLFRDSANGLYSPETKKRWITREDFYRLKDKDPYVRYCWSFGNGGESYLYARQIEPWKRALHHAYVLGDCSLMEEIAGPVPREGLRAWIQANADEIREKYIRWYRDEWLKAHRAASGIPEELPDDLEKEIERMADELREYLRDALKQSGLRAEDVNRHLGTKGMASHYFGESQWEFPTPEAYERLKKILPLRRGYPWNFRLLKSLQSLQSLESLQSLQSLERLQRLESLQSLQCLESLQRLESLQSLERLTAEHLSVSCESYERVPIPEDSVVYCDIPYEKTNCGIYGGFDHKAFFNWAAERPFPVYISSYQIDDSRFCCVWEKAKRSNSAAGGCGKIMTERIYTQAR